MILLDTSSLIWTAVEPARLSALARATIRADRDRVASVVCFWEIVIKAKALEIADPVSWWKSLVGGLGLAVLPIRQEHVAALAKLPGHHKDPFDRMLIAQCIVEKLPILTSDRMIRKYDVSVIW